MRNVKLWQYPTLFIGLFIALPVWAAPTSTKITIYNQSGYSDTEIFLVVYGKTPGFRHLDLLTGTLIPCSITDNTLTLYRRDGSEYPVKYCQYWVTLAQIKKPDGTYSFTCPPIVSARLFLSFQKPVYLHINEGPAVAEPSTDNPDNPTYETLWDKFEWTLDGAGLHANTTPIDFFAMPLQFSMKVPGESDKGPMGFSCSRGPVYNALNANPLLSPLKGRYRFTSPNNRNSALYFPSDYFMPYVDYVWTNHWQTPGSLKLSAGGYHWTGQIAGDVLSFIVDEIPSEIHSINKPTDSWDIFACAGVFAIDKIKFPPAPPESNTGPYNRDGAIKNEICSALNRSVMHLATSSWSDPNKYYQNTLPPPHEDKFKTNIYSQILHQVAINHLIYGYPYDDKYDRASYITNPNGTELVLTINNCKMGFNPALLNLLLFD